MHKFQREEIFHVWFLAVKTTAVKNTSALNIDETYLFLETTQ